VKKLVILLATGFGLGYSPIASGTVGTLPGVLIVAVVAMMPLLGIGWQIGLAIGLAALAVPICHVAEKFFGKKDDRRIVADEYLTFPLCVLGLPWPEHWWLLAVAFVVNRAMDVLKPPPARQLQRLTGGLGIVIDDFFSCLYALAINHAIWWVVQRFTAL